MNKKLLAVAVAGALAAPGIAFAQASAVTISGYFKVGLDNLNYSDLGPNTNNPNSRLNSSQMRISDGSSQLIFTVIEDLGNGLSAIGNLDNRFNPDTGAIAATGNTYVGLRSTAWGTLTTGRWDLHYFNSPSQVSNKAGALQAAATSLFSFIGQAPIANATRTPSVIKYQSPDFSGFSGVVAWSANPLSNVNPFVQPPTYSTAPAGEADMTSFVPPVAANASTRKGDAWNLHPKYVNGPMSLEYSYWRAKADAAVGPTALGAASLGLLATMGTLDQRGDSIVGTYQWGGLTLGLGWNRSRLDTAVGGTGTAAGLGAGTKVAQRTAWVLPVTYNWGPNTVAFHYARASNISSDVPGQTTDSTGAKMVSLVYNYDLSKRTSLGLTYSKINNDANANYQFFTSTALGSADATIFPGESPRLINVSIKHSF